jgi:hypothetical protein
VVGNSPQILLWLDVRPTIFIDDFAQNPRKTWGFFF